MKVLESIASYRDSLREEIDERIRANRQAIREAQTYVDASDFFNGFSIRNQEIRNLQKLILESRISNEFRGVYESTV